MFEKDEDYRKARKESKDEITKVIKVWSAREEALHDEGFQKGAEFGYKLAHEEMDYLNKHWKSEEERKANEWHYPSNGEYPNECEDVWCYCKGIGIKFCCVGHTIVGGDNRVRWWANNKTEELRVIAWKEIVLPELPKESE